MKNRIKIIYATMLCLPTLAFMPAVVYAVEVNDTDTTSNETKTENELKTTLQERLAKRKTDLKTKLAGAEEARLKLKCKAGQVPVKNLSGRIKGLETSRDKVYANLINKLTNVSEKLKERELDTATLDTQIAMLKTKIETFRTDIAIYKQAVSDLGEMDCVSDPAGFKASLETARSARGKLAIDAAAIKTFVKENIKPTLVTLRTQLGALDGNQESTEQ